MIDMERIDDDTEYTWTEEAAPLVLDGSSTTAYDTRTEDEKILDMLDRTNARIDALLAELDETRGHLANVQRYCLLHSERLNAIEQRLSVGD